MGNGALETVYPTEVFFWDKKFHVYDLRGDEVLALAVVLPIDAITESSGGAGVTVSSD